MISHTEDDELPACKEQSLETTFERDRDTRVWHHLGCSDWKAISFWALGKGASLNFRLGVQGHPTFFYRNWRTFDIIDNKGNSFQAIKTSDTLKHQPTAWPVPYACAQQWLWQLWTAGSMHGLAWHSRRAEIGLRALCSLPFTAQAGGKHPFIKAPVPHNTRGISA